MRRDLFKTFAVGVLALASPSLVSQSLASEATDIAAYADAVVGSPPAQRALEHSRSGTVVKWVDPDRGLRATFSPKPAFSSPSGEICREFTQTVAIAGLAQDAFGTACRQADGSWRLLPAQPPLPATVLILPPSPPPPTRVVYLPHPPIQMAPRFHRRPHPLHTSPRIFLRLEGGSHRVRWNGRDGRRRHR